MRTNVALMVATVHALAMAGAAHAADPKGRQPATAPSATAKAADPGAELTTATYGDWMLRCRRAPAAADQQPTRSCELVQSVIIQGQSAPIAQLAFGKVASNEPLKLTVVLPLNVSFPSTVKISASDKDAAPIELAWTRCMPIGCFASIEAKEDFLGRWRSIESAGQFSFKNSAGQDLTLPFSFRGLGRALDALAKEG